MGQEHHNYQETGDIEGPAIQEKNATENRECSKGRICGMEVDRFIEIFFAFIVTVFTGLLWYTSSKQLGSMQEQTAAMQAQLAEMKSASADTKTIAESSGVQAENAKTLAAAAIDQVKELKASVQAAQDASRYAREALILDQRPWVGFGEVNILSPLAEGQPLAIKARALNSGKSPAVYLQKYLVLKPWISPEGDNIIPLFNDPAIAHCFQPKPKWSSDLTGGIVLPGAGGIYISEKSPILGQDIVNVITKKRSASTVNDFMGGIPQFPTSEKAERLTIGLFLVGCIDYFDQFRKSHRISVCYLYDSTGVGRYGDFSNCAKGISAD
jgi:hypothetical protein